MGKRRSRRIRKALAQAKVKERDAVKEGEYETSLERIYGPRGVPEGSGVVIPLPPSILKSKGKTINGIVHAQSCVCKDCKGGDIPKRKVTIMPDSLLNYPDFYFEIYVATDSPFEEAQFAAMFTRSRCMRAKSLEKADLVVFTGGVDVDPALYGAEKHSRTSISRARDDKDIALYKYCLENGVAMLGICRGAQFLHVMNGGKLYQDVDGHMGDHGLWDVRKKEFIDKVSSVHHQMVVPNNVGGMEIIATSNRARNRWLDNKTNETGCKADIEAFFYRDTCCLGIQGHPEYQGYPHFTKWSLELVNDLIVQNPDFGWEDGCYRMRRELREERDKKLQQTVESRLNNQEKK